MSFANPQSPLDMLTPKKTMISTQYLQLKIGGDIAAMTGMCKALVAMDDAAIAAGASDEDRVLDVAFIREHTHGFNEFSAFVRRTPWASIERESGLTQCRAGRGGPHLRPKAKRGDRRLRHGADAASQGRA